MATGGGRGPPPARAGSPSERPEAASGQSAPAQCSSSHLLPAPEPSKAVRGASGAEGTAVSQKPLGQRGKKEREEGRREVQIMQNSRGSGWRKERGGVWARTGGKVL